MKFIAQNDFAKKLFPKLKAAFDRKEGMPDEGVKAILVSTINELISGATEKPAGAAVLPQQVTHEPANALPYATSIFQQQPARSISLVLLGEDHTNAEDDKRAKTFIEAINQDRLEPSLVVFERKMRSKYPTPQEVPIVREDGLTEVTEADFGVMFSKAQRSMLIAAYLVLVIGGGNQTATEKVLLFYGENHTDIFSFFEYFAQNSQAVHLLKRARTNYLIKSFVP